MEDLQLSSFGPADVPACTDELQTKPRPVGGAGREIAAIDVHGHYGQYVRNGPGSLCDALSSADAAEVVRRARNANIALTIVSPLSALLPRFHGDAVAGNIEAARVVSQTPGLRQYVVIDPRRAETFDQADQMLPQPQCAGIKIHPEEHGYLIREHGQAIFEFAARHKAVVLTHSSEQNSQAADFIPFTDEFPEVRLILAHIGCGWDGDLTHQVRAIQNSRKGNVYADTSSARSIVPGLIEWAVREVGADRVLFGTDTPLYQTAMQRARVDQADLTDDEKRLILRDNAIRLFGLPA
jgi:predicted TIM-barrel fold metal-dependent hydrolase